MTTPGSIASDVLDSVDAQLEGVVHTVSLIEPTRATYNATTAQYEAGENDHSTCRLIVETTKPVKDLFPAYIEGPGEYLVLIVGASTPPKEGWILRGTVDRVIKRVQDILQAGDLFYAVIE